MVHGIALSWHYTQLVDFSSRGEGEGEGTYRPSWTEGSEGFCKLEILV